MEITLISSSHDTCFLCGKRGVTHKHHCLHGSRRKKADEFGLTVYLCPQCHQELHDHGNHDLELKKLAQEKFEEVFGHEAFMDAFGKNYL